MPYANCVLCAQGEAVLVIPFNADNHSLSCGLNTSVPISHIETPVILIHMNRTVVFQTYFRCGAVFLISVSVESLLKAWSAEGKLLTHHSAHILYSDRTPPHKCGFLLMTVLLQDLTQSNSSLPVTKDTVKVCHSQF